MNLRVTNTRLNGVVVIDVECQHDDRGFFYESWNARDFAAAGLPVAFMQESHSRSARGVLRGIHFQDNTAPLGKLVRCTTGSIRDLAVDLRIGSPTFGTWMFVELSSDNRRQVYIPPGFGHAFQALSDGTEVQYKQTGLYAPGAERVIAWDDPELSIDWPLKPPVLSDRDRRGASLEQYRRQPAFTY